MSLAIVVTSINYPTRSLQAFARMEDAKLVVVGDLKTPEPYALTNAAFFSIAEQDRMFPTFSKAVPRNHYGRKMLGYLHAITEGMEVIYDTDDDNAPNKNWSCPAFTGAYPSCSSSDLFFNIYKRYTAEHIWPRGLPLSAVCSPDFKEAPAGNHVCDVGIWQGLANGDPDVDAIYRLTSGKLITFKDRGPCVIGEGSFVPCNSQNTFHHATSYPLLYLPSSVTFRYTDILRGIVAQPILWAAGLRLGYMDATVFQQRNEHDLMKDFESEVPMYLTIQRAAELCVEAVSVRRSMEDNLTTSYDALSREGIVSVEERALLDSWLSELTRCAPGRRPAR
jgi:hypothetical protein